MSRSGSNGLAGESAPSNGAQTVGPQSQTTMLGHESQGGDSHAAEAHDLSNGFENRTIEYERYAQERAQDRVASSNGGGPPARGSSVPRYSVGNESAASAQQMQQFSTAARPPGTGSAVDARVSGAYSQEQIPPMDRMIRYAVSQTGTQTVPVHIQPQFAVQEYPSAQPGFAQVRSQFEIRAPVYPGTVQYPERAGPAITGRELGGYGREQQIFLSQPNNHQVYVGQGPQYVTVQPVQNVQSVNPQPPYYSGVMVPQNYPQYLAQTAFPYPAPYGSPNPGSVPTTTSTSLGMNPSPTPGMPYAVPGHPRQFGQQSPNPQRFSQDLTPYQNQPIVQPIARNVGQSSTAAMMPGASVSAERPNRGPKPVVPPRGGSKITHDSAGHRKSASVDASSGDKPGQKYELMGQQEMLSSGMQSVQSLPENMERRYLAPVNQNPRTRQDGLYVETNGDTHPGPSSDTVATDNALYVSRPEHRKSASVDVTSSFQKRNDTITFTFPGENQDPVLVSGKKLPGSDLKRRDPGLASLVGPSGTSFDPSRQENRKSVISIDRKLERAVSPGQRTSENRHSDYFEEHRRSPLTLDQKRLDEVRRSPMPSFVPIREGQKSPSFVNQAFEKTRQELAVWAEQRQRQELELRTGLSQQTQPFSSTSPRSRLQSDDRKDQPRLIHQVEERRELRMSQSAFQPVPNISQTTIVEQRRHLRHVSADLTKHVELSRKEFDDQPLTGSVVNLGPATSNASSQRASPCNQVQRCPSANLESKLDPKSALTIVTEFGDARPIDRVDHIIHSHRKSQNATLLTHSKSQGDNLHSHVDCQSELVTPSPTPPISVGNHPNQQQQMHNQQSLDQISEKLSQFERQQSDLQTKLQCLRNQSHILDKVSQFQHQQSDLQAKMQSLQNQAQASETLGHQQQFQLTSGPDDVQGHSPSLQAFEQQQINDKLLQLQKQQSDLQIHQNNLHGQLQQTLRPGFVLSGYKTGLQYQGQSQIMDKLASPRSQHEDSGQNLTQIPSLSQMPLPNLAQFERSESARSSLQYRFAQCQDNSDSESGGNFNSSVGANFTGTLKKVPPEKPPRTSLIIQSPESEKPTSHWIEADAKDQAMDDHEIQSTVESILGPGAKVVDCEKKSCVREEEVLLINGVPVALEGPDGIAIKEAMITGQVPPCDLLNQLLVRAGILRAPVRLETSLSVKSSVITKEEVTVARGGKIVDERSRETKENNFYTSSTSEIWEPVGIIHNHRNLKPFDSSDESRPNSNASSDQGYMTNTSASHVLRERGGDATLLLLGCPICEDNDPDCRRNCIRGLGIVGSGPPKVPGVQTTTSAPTIFGTVASDLTPKDGNSRRSLPQTPAGCTGAKGLASNGASAGPAGPGLVNGSNVEHPDLRDGAGINTEHALVYRDGNLVSGSLEALVQHMVPTEEYYPDRAYLFAFLLSARLFIKPHELLGEVCALCEIQQNLNGEGGRERLHRFVPRLVQLLAEWTETFPYDFRDERVMGHVRAITQKVAAVDAAARQEVSALLQNLLLRLTALERYEEGLARLATDAATEQLTQVDVTELCPSASILAQQLTHVELERLSYIGPEEFVQAFAKESPHLETSFKDMKKTRNLESYVQWFNRLSYFVATEVCKHAKKKQRVRVVEYWIETARECFNIGNFNSLMAIIAGLNMSPISRLKKTWSKVQSAKFSILEHQMDPSSNFSSYRSTLKAAMWRSAGATDERQRIVVPFFSLLVKDLYFLNEGCSNKLPNGHINFEKFWQLAKQVTEFIAWKQVACPFEKNARVIAFLQASPVLTENSLALASFECEPPDNNPEKERYKSLKSELNTQ